MTVKEIKDTLFDRNWMRRVPLDGLREAIYKRLTSERSIKGIYSDCDPEELVTLVENEVREKRRKEAIDRKVSEISAASLSSKVEAMLQEAGYTNYIFVPRKNQMRIEVEFARRRVAKFNVTYSRMEEVIDSIVPSLNSLREIEGKLSNSLYVSGMSTNGLK